LGRRALCLRQGPVRARGEDAGFPGQGWVTASDHVPLSSDRRISMTDLSPTGPLASRLSPVFGVSLSAGIPRSGRAWRLRLGPRGGSRRAGLRASKPSPSSCCPGGVSRVHAGFGDKDAVYGGRLARCMAGVWQGVGLRGAGLSLARAEPRGHPGVVRGRGGLAVLFCRRDGARFL